MSSTAPFRFDNTAHYTVWVGTCDGKPRAEVHPIASRRPTWAEERWLDCALLSEAEMQASDWLARRAT